MIEKKAVIKNETGIHARPASMFVQEANKYDSDISIFKEGKEANAKSILGVMSLGIKKSTEVIVKAEGGDEAEAVGALIGLIGSGFGE